MTPVAGGPLASEAAFIPGGRLFRPVDWIAFVLVSFVVMAGYLLTIAPDLTLEDSGELAVASMYAGVPHPPGYPVWTVYTWLFTKLLPFSNIAWRVAVSSAFAAAVLVEDVRPGETTEETGLLERCPLGEGVLPTALLGALLAAHVPAETPVILLPGAQGSQRQALGL